MAEQHGKTLVPQIRFAGFTDPWGQRKLGELCSFSKGCGYSKNDLRDQGTPIILYGRLYTNYETQIHSVDTFVKPLENSVYSEGGEVIIPASGETAEDISIASVVEKPGIILGGDLNVITSSADIDPVFLALELSYGKPHFDLAKRAQGKSVVHIHNEDIANVFFGHPNIAEQRRIGAFFDRLDSLITLHQRKYDKLCVLKISMLDKMFPKGGSLYPEIRFAGFTDPWEQRKLGEVAHFINGRAYSQNELLSSGKYPVLRVGNFYTNDSWYYSNLELEDKNYAYEGDLLYTWSATFGPHIWHGNKVIYHYHIWKVQLEAAFEKLFAFQLLERDKERILSDKNGSTMVHITKIGIENTSVLMPCSVIEQRQIGAFFDRLDSLITLHQRKYCGVVSWMLGVALVRLSSEK